MSITLGGITLSNDMVIDNKFSWQPFVGSSFQTMGGRFCYYSTVLHNGRPIDLIATQESGWITYTVYKQVEALIDISNIIVLDYNGDMYNVLFRFDDPPVLDFTPLVNRANLQDTDYMYGTIKLMEVG